MLPSHETDSVLLLLSQLIVKPDGVVLIVKSQVAELIQRLEGVPYKNGVVCRSSSQAIA